MERNVSRRRAPCQISFRHDRLALTRAAAEDMPEYIDLYECGNILAIKGNPEGQIRLSVGSHKYRQNIRVRQVMEFVRDKYECEAGDILSAWYCDGVLMFCRIATKEDLKTPFDERFKMLDFNIKVPEKYSLRVRSHTVTLSSAAGALFKDRLMVYENEDVLAFVPDEAGGLWTAEYSRSGTKAIYSTDLAEHIKRKYGKDEETLYGWEEKGVAYFSSLRTTLRKPLSSGDYERKSFEMRQDTVTVNILQNSRLLVSELGAVVLEKHIALHQCGNLFALVSDPEGEFKTVRSGERAGCDITGRDLVRYIKKHLVFDKSNNCRLHAQVRGNAVYFTKGEITYLPPFRKFKPVEFGRVCQINVISAKILPSGSGRFYISQASREIIKEGASLWRNGDVLALVSDAEGDFKLSASGYVGSRALGEYMKSELGIAESRRFYIRNGKQAVFFSEKRLDENTPLKLEDFELVVFNLTIPDKAPKGARKAHPVGDAWEKQRQVRDKRKNFIPK